MSRTETVNNSVARPGSRPIAWVLLAPLGLFATVAVLLGIGLTLNPREVPSPLIGKPVPEFALPPSR